MGLAVPAMPQMEGTCGIRPDARTVAPFSRCGLWLLRSRGGRWSGAALAVACAFMRLRPTTPRTAACGSPGPGTTTIGHTGGQRRAADVQVVGRAGDVPVRNRHGVGLGLAVSGVARDVDVLECVKVRHGVTGVGVELDPDRGPREVAPEEPSIPPQPDGVL